MSTVKFNVKDVSIFGARQASEGVAVIPVADDAMAVTTLSGSTTNVTEAFEFLGDSLSRDEITTLKDTSAEVTAETFVPSLGTLNPGLLPNDAPLSQFFQCCGAKVSVDAAGVVEYTNSFVENTLLTIEYRKSSPEVSVANTQKLLKFTDIRGQVDINIEAGARTKANFKFLGNTNLPSMVPELIPDFKTQILDIAGVVRKATMIRAVIKKLAGNQIASTISTITGDGTTVTVTTASPHGILDTESVKIEGTAAFDGDYEVTFISATSFSFSDPTTGSETTGTATKSKFAPETMCINTFTAPNFFGFNYERYLLTCQEGYTKDAVPTDVTAVVLEDEVGGDDFNPDINIENFFEVIIKYGTGAGKNIEVIMDKLQLADVSDAEIGTSFGREISFRNTGKSFIRLS